MLAIAAIVVFHPDLVRALEKLVENIQFEDDEYYYYVKAVPKVGVAVPEKEIKRITGERPGKRNGSKKSEGRQPDAMNEEKTDEILLTRSLSKELGIDQEKDKTE